MSEKILRDLEESYLRQVDNAVSTLSVLIRPIEDGEYGLPDHRVVFFDKTLNREWEPRELCKDFLVHAWGHVELKIKRQQKEIESIKKDNERLRVEWQDQEKRICDLVEQVIAVKKGYGKKLINKVSIKLDKDNKVILLNSENKPLKLVQEVNVA